MTAKNTIPVSYKDPKTLDKMIAYLKNTKNVRFNTIPETDAKNILLSYNYINIISPFKHHFALCDKRQRPIKDNGKHIYNKPVEFSSYYEKYLTERSAYPIIMENIIIFETHFKAILAYHIFNTENLSTSQDLFDFITNMNTFLLSQSMASHENRKGIFKTFKEGRIKNMNKQLNDLISCLYDYHDIYCYFDRLSLGKVLTIFTCLPTKTQNLIFKDLYALDSTLETNEVPGFIRKVFTLVAVRNRVMHANSLEILINYYNEKEGKFRTADEKKKIKKVITLLSTPRKK